VRRLRLQMLDKVQLAAPHLDGHCHAGRAPEPDCSCVCVLSLRFDGAVTPVVSNFWQSAALRVQKSWPCEQGQVWEERN
jgi:hypothetical protein